MRKLLIFIILILPLNVYATELPILNSEKVLIYDRTFEKEIYSLNNEEVTSIASLTKIMTVITAILNIDNLDEDEKVRNKFKTDMIITCVTHIDGDPEKETVDKAIVKGAIFDFRKNLLPVEFSATNPNAMRYFESLDASQKNPVFTCVWGRQVSEVVIRQIITESAFGEDEVRPVKNTRRDFVITGASKEPYLWDDESSITAAELNEAIQKREVDLAAMKKRQDEYKASKNNNNVAPAQGGFNF